LVRTFVLFTKNKKREPADSRFLFIVAGFPSKRLLGRLSFDQLFAQTLAKLGFEQKFIGMDEADAILGFLLFLLMTSDQLSSFVSKLRV
jgi:hypothetical protein